ncbi:hypothetical protein ACHAW6_002176 [Cyclotella cf. meneghiniana]
MVRTEKAEPNRTRATMGGNLINYPEDVGTPMSNLFLIKIFFNSVISTDGAKFGNIDVSIFYLMMPLKWPEFAKVKLKDISKEIVRGYNLRDIATPDKWVYIKVSKGMYGLPQARSLGNDLLELRLSKEGYNQSKILHGLWKHTDWSIMFTLVVDDFGIKDMTNNDLDCLIKTLRQFYDISVDLSGKEYVKIELDWDYKNRCIHLSMASYLKKALAQFGVKKPKKL